MKRIEFSTHQSVHAFRCILTSTVFVLVYGGGGHLHRTKYFLVLRPRPSEERETCTPNTSSNSSFNLQMFGTSNVIRMHGR